MEVDTRYPENLHKIQKKLPFLPEKMKIEKVKNLIAILHN